MEVCSQCGHKLIPIYFKSKYEHKWRYEIDYLLCENCGKKTIVDCGYGAKEWHYEN